LRELSGANPHEVEQLVATPLERILYQIDGVEYVYNLSRENSDRKSVYVGRIVSAASSNFSKAEREQ
jgi:multidrug efflux pump subunit AcrB